MHCWPLQYSNTHWCYKASEAVKNGWSGLFTRGCRASLTGNTNAFKLKQTTDLCEREVWLLWICFESLQLNLSLCLSHTHMHTHARASTHTRTADCQISCCVFLQLLWGFNDFPHVERHSLAFSCFSLFTTTSCSYTQRLCLCVFVRALPQWSVCVYFVHAGDLSKSGLARLATTVES